MTLPKGIQYCVISFFTLLVLANNLPAQDQKKSSSPDSLRILTWKINLISLQFDTIRVDTALNLFQFYNPVYKMGLSQTYLGNLGLPAITNTFSERKFTTPFLFMQALEPYMMTPEKNIFFNTHRPYTNLFYTTGGPSNNVEESMRIIHTQNITPYWNMGVNFTIFASKGLYPAQRTKDRVFTVHTNYQKKNYLLLASYHLNKFTNQENGGLISDSSVNLKNQDFLPVNLSNAKNRYVSNTFFLLQSLKFGGRDSANHNDSIKKRIVFPASLVSLIFRYDRTRKTFEESDLKTLSTFSTTDSAYFKHFYYSKQNSADSSICRKFSASLRYTLKENSKQKVPIGLSFMVVQELLTYGFYNRLDTLKAPLLQAYTHNHFNFKGGASISRSESNRFILVATGYFTFLGYEIGNYWLNGTLDMNFPYHSENKLHLAATLRDDRPDFFYTYFVSNYIRWNNTLKNTFRNEAEASYSMPHDFVLQANIINMNNFVYFNDSGYPDQTSKNLLVMSGSLSKTFRIWKYVSVNKFIFQYSSNQTILPLPAASVYLSNYLEFQPVKNVLYAQFGFDIFYHSQYYGYAYDPVTGMFHTQNEKMIGNYPFVDPFLNLKLKRTRFYFKYEHADYSFITRNYFNALHYPMSRGTFRFGLSWAFYD
jgi:hypothetical protein